MRAIAFLNQKGGVGKTTAAVNAGVGLVRRGRKVVLVDLDPQGHMTRSLGVDPGEAGLHQVIKGEVPLGAAMVEAEGALMDTVEAARSINPVLRTLGIVLTRYNHRKRLCREVAQAIRSHFPELLLETRIRECVALAEAPGFGRSIFSYAPRTMGALDFTNLSREIDVRGLS